MFTLETMDQWPAWQRPVLLAEHGYSVVKPTIYDPFEKAVGQFGVHGREVGGGVFACGHCESTSTRRGDLREHLNVHLGLKPFQCRFCDSTFAYHAHCTKHERSSLPGHLNQKSNLCDVCGKQYHDALSLRAHLQTHKDGTTYVKWNPKTKTHDTCTFTKPAVPDDYTCAFPDCGKTFANHQNCNRHKRLKHPDFYKRTKHKRKHISSVKMAPPNKRVVFNVADWTFTTTRTAPNTGFVTRVDGSKITRI